MKRAVVGSAFVVALLAVGITARVAREVDDDDDDDEDTPRTEYWRAHIAIRGLGRVATTTPTATAAFDCSSFGGDCGPKLVTFTERQPPLLRATGAPGWRFDHWESSLRTGAMPDGEFYLNGFGYEDTGQTELVTAVFRPR